jgi:hypothetical protein
MTLEGWDSTLASPTLRKTIRNPGKAVHTGIDRPKACGHAAIRFKKAAWEGIEVMKGPSP